MLNFILIIAVAIGLWEGITLIRAKKWSELLVVGTITIITLLVGVGKLYGLPTPLELLERWLLPVGKAFFKRL